MGTNVFVNPSHREQINFTPEQGFEMIGKLNKVAEGGISLCKIDEHIHVTLRRLLSTGKRAEDADLCHAELCTDSRGCSFKLFLDHAFLPLRYKLPGHLFTSFCNVLGNR